MGKQFAKDLKTFVLVQVILLGGLGVFSDAEANMTPGNEARHGAQHSPAPLKWDYDLTMSESSAWNKRFFDVPFSQYNLPKNSFRSPNGPGWSLKSPGKLPGIEFGVEMHSFGALQSVVPPEKMPKALSSQQERPLLLPPSNIAPDYNAGFLRFTW